jgi:hypothetical protein
MSLQPSVNTSLSLPGKELAISQAQSKAINNIEKYQSILKKLESSLTWQKFTKAIAGTFVVCMVGGPKAFAVAISVVLAVFIIEKLAHLYFTHKYNQNMAIVNSTSSR